MTALHRRPGIVSVAALGGITLAVAAAHAVAPEWARATGLDVWSYPGLVDQERATVDERKHLEASHDRLAREIEACDHVVGLLINGQLPLPDAIDEIARINHDRPGFVATLRSTYSEGLTDRQLVAQYILVKIRGVLADDPHQLAEVLTRLEAECQRIE